MDDDYKITYSDGSTVGGHISTATHPTTTITCANFAQDFGGGIDHGSSNSVTLSILKGGAIESVIDTGSEFTYNVPDTFVLQDFVHSMPELSRVKLMCEQYPALNKVYEQFKLIYKMVDQDYKGNIESKEALF